MTTVDPRWNEALPHQRAIMEEIERLGFIHPENSSPKYETAQEAINRILGSPTLGELMDFESWANSELGYTYDQIDGIWRWRKVGEAA